MQEQNQNSQTSQTDDGNRVGDAALALQALQQLPNDAPDVPYDAPVESNLRAALGPIAATATAAANMMPAYAFASFIPDKQATIKTKEEIEAFVRVVSLKDDIVLSDVEIHPVLLKKNGPKTRIYHIKGILVVNIDAKALEQYCRKLNGRIKDIRKKRKEILCRELISLKIADDRFGPPTAAAASAETNSNSTAPNNNKQKRVRVNYYRVVNVLALESIKPLVIGINSHLSRADIDAGRKAGKELFLAMSQAYNDVLNDEIDKVKWGFGAEDCDPSDYEDLSPTQIEAAFRSLKMNYQTYRVNWTLSGQHEDPFEGEMSKPFDDFVGGKMHFVYLHNLLQEQRELLGNFDDETIFSESTAPSTSKKKKKQSKKDHNSMGVDTEELVETMRQRNAVIERSAQQEIKTAQATELKLFVDLRSTARSTKRKAKENLMNSPKIDGDKAQMQWAVANVRKKIGQSQPKKAPPSLSQSSIESDSQRWDYATEYLQAEQEEKEFDARIKSLMDDSNNNNTE